MVQLDGLYNGALVQIYLDGVLSGMRSVAASRADVRLWVPMQAGQQVTAQQTLCNASPVSFPTSVSTCGELPAPVIHPPEVGAMSLTIVDAVPDARVTIFGANGEEIGDGGGGEVRLVRPIRSGEEIVVVQTLGACESAYA